MNLRSSKPGSSSHPWPPGVRYGFLALLLTATLWVVLAPLTTIPVGIETRAQLEVFSMDEPAMVYRVEQSLRNGNLDPGGEFNYGAFYPTVAVGVLELIRVFGAEPTEKRIALTLRLLSWSSYVGLLVLVFLLLRRLGADAIASWLALLLLASGTGIHYWSQQIHPDLLQSFLVVLAFWLVARRQTWPWTILASTVCGVAFGTKYSGAFAVLFVVVPAALSTLSTLPTRETALFVCQAEGTSERGASRTVGATRVRSLVRVAAGLSLSAAGFVGGWLASNPYVLASLPEFWADLQYERIHVGFGHYVPESRNPLVWLALWFRDARPAGIWLVVVGTCLTSSQLLRGRHGTAMSRENRRFLWVVLAYVAACVLYLGVQVNMRRMRYALHFWPLLFVLVGYGLSAAFAWIRTWKRGVGLVFLIVAVTSAVWAGTGTVREHAALAQRAEDPVFAASEWLVTQYRPGTPILADVYAYRDPYFENFTTVLGIRPHDLVAQEPFLVVLVRRMSGRFSWKAEGTRFADHDFVLGPGQDAEAIQEFHHELFAPTSPYRVVYENEAAVVLELKSEIGFR